MSDLDGESAFDNVLGMLIQTERQRALARAEADGLRADLDGAGATNARLASSIKLLEAQDERKVALVRALWSAANDAAKQLNRQRDAESVAVKSRLHEAVEATRASLGESS